MLRKVNIPPLVVKQVVRTVMRKEAANGPLQLSQPEGKVDDRLKALIYDIAATPGSASILRQVGQEEVQALPETMDLYTAAVELAATYHVAIWDVYDELRRLYGGPDLPVVHLGELAQQIEEQTRGYEVHEETVERAIALVRPEGFQREALEDGSVAYTAEIAYPVDRERLLLSWEKLRERNKQGLGFHYSPYDFDSQPEQSFFVQLLDYLNVHAEQVEDIYFTGALTDPKKTGFYVDYMGDDARWHRYTPDFIIRRRDGRCLIVEIKSAQFRAATQEDLGKAASGGAAITTEGRKAVALKRWEQLNPERIKYEIIYTAGEESGYNQLRVARQFVEEG